ncbi:uncharacterized protein LOC128233365 [Mya arenaria]|uniref:uncharacterized protein LOC128233365 n=1 Tax=Mya arenaria TaxID=6604 RepID=UPI0022E11AAB|nr:uncharacterized protein LOC128233365 [Mya arenaria]
MEVHTHTDLRLQLVHFIEKLPETTKAELHHFLTRDMDTYLHSMLKNGTYADHVCLQMMCKMLKCSITLYSGPCGISRHPHRCIKLANTGAWVSTRHRALRQSRAHTQDCTRRLCGCAFQDEEEHMPVFS